jgi:hypothetical protein
MGTLLKPTTKGKRMPGSAGAGVNLTFAKIRNPANTAWIDASFIYRRNAGNTAWVMEYSTPSGALSGGGPASTSNGTGAGTPSVSATATPGGVNSGNLSYSWQHSSGPNNYSYANTTTAIITGSYAFTGVGNGVTSSLAAEAVYCIVTDNDTGAQYSTDPITIGPFSHTNTTPAFSAHTNSYFSSSGTEYVPAGATSLTVKVIGGGAPGGQGRGFGSDQGGGGGGGSGDIETVTRAIAPGDVGAPIYWSVAAASTGDTSSTTGSVAAGSLALTAPGGLRGDIGSGGGGGGAGGNGGAGPDGDSYGAGGKGGNALGSAAGVAGNGGKVVFIWT